MAVTIGASAGLIPAHAGKTPVGRAVPSVAWAHPRSRGENAERRRGGELLRGSSPLTRGKLAGSEFASMVIGLIPAHAGKTVCPASGRWSRGAHPRSRGENTALLPRGQSARGSSPLTRGKRAGRHVFESGARLIPAHAGKTASRRPRAASPRAHPRSRGENSECCRSSSARAGSSPLTRGKRFESRAVDRRLGLIPAHAGKTTLRTCSTIAFRAHPRSRGENWLLVALRVGVEGSSPLTRGKRGEGEQGGPLAGLIPAHAGKTARLPHLARARRAHPRSRGENFTFGLSNRVVTGSSPLTRGKRGRASARSSLRGLIPAHAGKTSYAATIVACFAAHPRSRGENPSPVRPMSQ